MSWVVMVSAGGAALAKMISSSPSVLADPIAILDVDVDCQLSRLESSFLKAARNSICNMMIRVHLCVMVSVKKKGRVGEVGSSKGVQDLDWDPDQDRDQDPAYLKGTL